MRALSNIQRDRAAIQYVESLSNDHTMRLLRKVPFFKSMKKESLLALAGDVNFEVFHEEDVSQLATSWTDMESCYTLKGTHQGIRQSVYSHTRR